MWNGYLKLFSSCASQRTHFRIQLIPLQNLANLKWQTFNHIRHAIWLNVNISFHQYNNIGKVEIYQKYQIFLQVLYSKRKKKKSALQHVKYSVKRYLFFVVYSTLNVVFTRVRNRRSRFLFFILSELTEICLKRITHLHMNIMKFERKMPEKNPKLFCF